MLLLFGFALAGAIDGSLPAAAFNGLLLPTSTNTLMQSLVLFTGSAILFTASAILATVAASWGVSVLLSCSRSRFMPTMAASEGMAIVLALVTPALGTALGYAVWLIGGAIVVVASVSAGVAARLRQAGSPPKGKRRMFTWAALIALTALAPPLAYLYYSSVSSGS
jgi:hypothetical protein